MDFFNDYINFKEAYKLLNVSAYMFRRIVKENELDEKIYVIKKGKYVSKSLINELIYLQKKFWNEHYTAIDSEKIIGENLYKIESVKVPSYAKDLTFTTLDTTTRYNIAFRKNDVDYISQLYKKEKNDSYCVSEDEFKEVLGLKHSTFISFIKEYKLEFILQITEKKKYFLKDDVEFFREQRSKLEEKYVTTSMAKKSYGKNVGDILWSLCKSGFKVPTFCKSNNIIDNYQEYLYDREEVEFYVHRRNFYSHVNNVLGATDFETFKIKVSLYSDKITNFENSEYTKEKWFEFVSERLSKSKNIGDRSKADMINMFVNATLDLQKLIVMSNIVEIYSVSTNQINMWLLTVTNQRKKHFIYQFLHKVSEDIKLRLKKDKNTKKGFKFDRIDKIDINASKKNEQNDKSKNIYNFDTYIKIFNHLINIQVHIKRAIEDRDKNSGDITYVSVWLYALLHLNNGWRHGDVTCFPRLYFRDLLDEYGIRDVKWFEKNTISEARSRRIISRIVQYDFRISKTEVYGHFFCSDKLAPAIATALLMIECIYQYNYIGVIPELNEPIMKFEGYKFNEPTDTLLKRCFENCKISNFRFSSMKMNRTVLTLIYNTACAMSPSGYNALILPQYLRAHIEEMSTIQYVQFSSEQLEFLSGELFERGEFGFITDSLLNLISDKPEKSIDRTEEIKHVDSLLGDKQKQEAICGMINYFRNEKEEILHLLNNMSFDNCLEVLSNIYMNNIPSMQSNIQCLFSEYECQNDSHDCKVCKYKIPNIYVLKTISDMLKEEMNLYFNCQHIGKKIKLSAQIHKKVDVIMEAIDKFGREYVYNCMDMNRDEFRILFNRILDVKDLVKLI